MESYNKYQKDDKAGYNQSYTIVDLLGHLRCTFNIAMMYDNYKQALESIRAKLNVISGKVKKQDIDDMDTDIYLLEDQIPYAESVYIYNGKKYPRFPQVRKEVKRLLEHLGRKLEKLEDRYGYGMISQEDPRMAILQR